jgi:hypothetical protein
MKQKIRIRTGIVLFSLLLTTWSCQDYFSQFKDINISSDVELEPSVAAPLVYGSFSIQDILDQLNDSIDLIYQTEDSLIFVFYEDTAFSMMADTFITVPEQISNETYIDSDIDIPEWDTLGIGRTFAFTKVEKLQFEIEEGDRVDSLVLKGGNLNINIFSEFRHSGRLWMTSSNIYDPDGDTLNRLFTISEVDGSFTSNTDYDLTDYKMTMDEENDSAFITIYYNLELTKSPAGISSDEECGIIMTFEDLKFQSIFGHIADRSITDMNEIVALDVWESIDPLPDVYFADPRFNLAVYNSFGIPVSMDLNLLRARSYKDGSFLDLTFKNDTMTPYTIYAPTVDMLGQTVVTERHFNVETCNIDELIASLPDQLEFDISVSTGNPDGLDEQNFLLDTSKIRVEAEVELPLWFRTSGYTLKDTIEDIELGTILENVDFVERAYVRLLTTNELPLEAAIQVYFVDAGYAVLDSLFDAREVILEAAPVDANGELDRTLLVEDNLFEVELYREDLDKLTDAVHIIFTAHLVTSDEGSSSVKIYSQYRLVYDVAMEADFKIDPSELGGNE